MNLFARLARNSLWVMTARVGAQVCAVIVTYLLARRLSVAGFGEYSFLAAAIMIGNTLTTFGSDMVLIREIAAKSELSRLFPALILQLGLSCLFIFFIFLFAPFLPNQTSESLLALRVYNFALIPLAFFTVFTSALRGWQRMDSYALLNLAVAGAQVIAIALFVPQGTSVLSLARLLLVIQILAAVLAGMLCALHIPGFRHGWQFSLRETLSLFVACVPLAVIAVVGILYQKSSLLMLSSLGGASMAGWFSAAARAAEAARIGHFSVFTALYPAMANAGAQKDSFKTFRLSWILLIVLAAALAVLLFLFAKPLVDIFFGVEYAPSIPVLKVLSWTLIPYTVNSFLSLALLAAKEERALLRALLVSLIILVLMNLWLIPGAGQIGAAWAILVAETVQSALLLFEWKSGNLFPQKGRQNELPDLSRQI